MALWPLLDQFLPLAGARIRPFGEWRTFFEDNMGNGDSGPVALLRLALQGGQGKLPNASLEFAVRLTATGISGAAVIGVPLPGKTMSDSLAHQRGLLVDLLEHNSQAASQLALFDTIYPPNVDFNWLAPQARGLYFAVAYRANKAEPIIKCYYTSSLDNTRTHQEIIGAVLETQHLEQNRDLAIKFDKVFSPFSTHRGIGVDIVESRPLRMKLYQRVDWQKRELVKSFANENNLFFEENLWEDCSCFDPNNGSRGASREFELSLDLKSKPQFKCNFFLDDGGQQLVAMFLKNVAGWNVQQYNEICQLCAEERYFLHAMALSIVGEKPDEINLYFMR